jgi:regulatory protein
MHRIIASLGVGNAFSKPCIDIYRLQSRLYKRVVSNIHPNIHYSSKSINKTHTGPHIRHRHTTGTVSSAANFVSDSQSKSHHIAIAFGSESPDPSLTVSVASRFIQRSFQTSTKSKSRHSSNEMKYPQKRRQRKLPRDLGKYLQFRADRYLMRFNAPAGHLKVILHRIITRLEIAHQTSLWNEELETKTDQIIANVIKQGLVDDVRYTKTQYESMLRRGKSFSAIRGYLFQKRVPPAIIDQVMQPEEQSSEERAHVQLQSARLYARKKRIGAHRPKSVEKYEHYQRDLGRMMRQGFPYDICRRVLNETETDPVDDEY